MVATSYFFGHEAEWDEDNEIWVYSDTKKEVVDGSRACPKCKEFPTEEGYDPCIGRLPDVEYACCGHGIPLVVNSPIYACVSGDEKSKQFKTLRQMKKYFKTRERKNMKKDKDNTENIITIIYDKIFKTYKAIKKFFSTLNKYDNSGDKMFLTRSQGRGKRH